MKSNFYLVLERKDDPRDIVKKWHCMNTACTVEETESASSFLNLIDRVVDDTGK